MAIVDKEPKAANKNKIVPGEPHADFLGMCIDVSAIEPVAKLN